MSTTSGIGRQLSMQAATSRAIEQVRLGPLMARTQGHADVVIALIDGPVAAEIPGLSEHRIREVPGPSSAMCALRDSAACMHGTFVAAMLVAMRGGSAPAICPACTLVVRPIFPEAMGREAMGGPDPMPSTTPEVLAAAIVTAIEAGARIVNLSLAIVRASMRGERDLRDALDLAARRGVIVVAAAGNQGGLASSALTRHGWVIPVSACDAAGAPLGASNIGSSIGRRGLASPGVAVTSLGSDGKPTVSGGTSVAAPFVTGAIALLWSEHPSATAAAIKRAVLSPHARRRAGIVPPLLDAWGAYETLRRSRQTT
jgi:subtilisin family serine protease